jgi:tryptophan 2,3-dioxygenase
MFPYAVTLQAVRQRGKHFIEPRVLQALDHARRCAAAKCHGADAFLEKFLDVVLDKYDHKYNYISYTAMPLLEHVRLDVTAAANPCLLQHIHDVTVCSLIGDALGFELNRLDAGDSYLTEMLPSAELLERRINFALRSIAPALLRLGYGELTDQLPVRSQAAHVVKFCSAQSLAYSQFILDVSMLPVYVVHDEHLFIRILQTLDMTFISVASLLKCALQAFEQELHRTTEFIRAANSILQEGLRHFHTLSTMQKASFSTFREFTTGASAIQSVNYKLMESLCRNPDKERLKSLAYASVPGLQQALRAGSISLDDQLAALRRKGGSDPATVQAIETAMLDLGETVTRWRHSHYGIAKKYLGEGTGTGHTEGTPYLKMVKDLPVFTSVFAGAASASDH